MKNFVKIIICLSCFFFGCNAYPYSKKEATSMAKNYITEKYNQEMKYLFTYFSPWWVDGRIYRVYFTPVNDEKLRFYVDVGGGRDSPIRGDNYLLVRFTKYSEKYFQNKMNDIWNNMDVFFWINNEYKNMVNPPVELNENMNPENVKEYIGIYFISIKIKKEINELSMQEEAHNIMKAIEIIKEKGYTPDNIYFRYDNEVITFRYEPSMDTSQRNLQESYYYWNMVGNQEEIKKRILEKIE